MHAGRVQGVGVVGRSCPRARGAHVKAGAHISRVRSLPPLSRNLRHLRPRPRVAESRAELRADRGHGAARRPSPSALSACTWPPGCSPKGVDRVRASPHHVAHIPAHPAPLRPRPPARAPRRVGARGRGAQQPLLGPWAGDVPRLGPFCRVRPAPHAVAYPAPHLTRAHRGAASPVDGGGRRASPSRRPHAPVATNRPAASAPRRHHLPTLFSGAA